ncbi:MAG: hypothetical protein OXE85_05350 [Roseovarius sp.]|nr:hypothetical protein [Roseovarius sp.]
MRHGKGKFKCLKPVFPISDGFRHGARWCPNARKPVERGRSRHVAPQPVYRRGQNAEHDLRENLRVAPGVDVAAAKVVLQPRAGGPAAVADRSACFQRRGLRAAGTHASFRPEQSARARPQAFGGGGKGDREIP